MPQFAEAISGAEEAPAFLDRWPVWLTVSVALILGFLHGVRRGDGHPAHAGRHRIRLRGRQDRHRRRHGLQLRLWLNVSLQSLQRPLDKLAVREHAGRCYGIRLRWDQEEHTDRKLWVIGGDGAMYDIGFQSLSRMLMSGMDIKVLVLDTQVYSNTGGQTRRYGESDGGWRGALD